MIRFSQIFIPTLKETPADAEAVSHKLLLRAGMARKLASGLYIYLPLGLRLINKIAAIVREEMNLAGFQELLLPMVQPADLWEETGRWNYYGKELLRFKDRNGRDYCLGPTHEEVVTDLIRNEVKSYKQLPLRVYQIQTKFRDEMRPRFGLMRSREFLMKDAYSFDSNENQAEESYRLMHDAYMRIFSRIGLRFRAVEADTGSIGGNFSHEFMVLAETGEDTIAACKSCSYAANVERAEVIWQGSTSQSGCPETAIIETPGLHTVEEVATALAVPQNKLIKTLIFLADQKPVAVLAAGNRDINEAKLKQLLGAETIELAPKSVVEEITGAATGFAGPVGLNIPIYADNELKSATDYITGANRTDAHLLHVDLVRDVNITSWGDLRTITDKDPCPRCGGKIELAKGIEVGHIFMLGLKYSKPMHAVFLDESGREKEIIMGCYGIGVSRIAAAAIEQGHDEKGIVLPPAIAPFACDILNLDPKNEEIITKADEIGKIVEDNGLDVLLDDRIERPGVKFNDADLLGAPMQIIIGAKSLARGIIECKNRLTGEKSDLPVTNFAEEFNKWHQKVVSDWKNHERFA